MFDLLAIMFTWLPSPLNVILFGAVCISLVIVIAKLIAKIIDLIPFL